MKTITARILDSTHLELSVPVAVPKGEYIQVSIPDTNGGEKLWLETGKKHFLEAFTEDDAIYDKLFS